MGENDNYDKNKNLLILNQIYNWGNKQIYLGIKIVLYEVINIESFTIVNKDFKIIFCIIKIDIDKEIISKSVFFMVKVKENFIALEVVNNIVNRNLETNNFLIEVLYIKG